MRRRDFIVVFGGAVASSSLCRHEAMGQQTSKAHRIGYLGFAPAATSATRVEAFLAGLRDLGYVEGKNLVVEFRWGNNPDQLRELAAELVLSNVELIFGTSSTEVGAARQATTTIPIVFATHADPVGTGHVASLARPGGNITGLSVLQTDLTAKAIEILKEAVPLATRFGILSSPTVPSHQPTVEAARAAAEKLGLALHTAIVESTDDFEAAFASLERAGVHALFVAASSLTVRSNPTLLADLALKNRVPTMFGSRDNVVAGGFMSYAPDQVDLSRRAATYVDKILRGTKPSDLPVEQASKYQFVINLRTSKALGITVPPTLLARADELIE
jgi:putative tryptophan/tyrosine transport system substrate-binding protein